MSDLIVAALIGAVATVVAAALGVWFGRQNERRSAADLLDERNLLGIRIGRPANGEIVERGHIEVTGKFDSRPAGVVKIFLLTSGTRGTMYWPQVGQPIEFLDSRKEWRGTAYVVGNGRIIAVTAGTGGQALFRYFEKVGSARNEYLPIDELPADVVEHDHVLVQVKNHTADNQHGLNVTPS